MFLAAVLTLGISIEIDLTRLINRYDKPTDPEVTCGIKVVGYHIAGRAGQTFKYGRRTWTIPAEGYIELIAQPRVTHYTVDGRELPLEDGVSPLDPFSFRWINLPATPIADKGETNHE